MKLETNLKLWEHIANIAKCAEAIYSARENVIDELATKEFKGGDFAGLKERIRCQFRNPVPETLEMINDILKQMNQGGADGRKVVASPAHQKGEGSDGSNSR